MALVRIELVALTFAGLLLCALTVAMTGSESSRAASCHNNLRQLGRALLCYADDNSGYFPPRASNPLWPERLRLFFKDVSILTCPSDGPHPASFGSGSTNLADASPRSYILNGWNDYYAGLPPPTAQFPASAIVEPAQTILFGEKATESGHFWFDYWQGDDFIELENGRHYRSGKTSGTGASNHAFADGSVRLLKWGAAFSPVNLWFVEPELRSGGIPLASFKQ
jgi:hypothetical protein